MIKTFFKRLMLLVLALLILISAFAAHEYKADKPFFFRVFLDRTLLTMAFESPETLTSLGFLESFGITGHNAKLDDDSPEKGDELFAELPKIKQTLLTYNDADLTENDLLSKEIALYLLNIGEEFKPYRYYNYPVNQLFGVQSGYPSFMEAQHQIHSLEDANNYLSRLELSRVKFAQVLKGIQMRTDIGIIPPRFVIDRVLDEMTAFVDTPAKDNILYTSLVTKLNDAPEITQVQAQKVLASAEQDINEYVYPAYTLLINYFTGLREKAGEDDGLWQFPAGDTA